MIEHHTVLAVIPARGGSKRLPRKNLLPLGGKPLIGWTIEAALQSRYIDRIVVTSDDPEILAIARDYGVEALKRPDELATDTAETFEAVEHAVQHSPKSDFVVLLQPTSPLRKAHHIDEALEKAVAQNADAVVSVCETDHSPLWSNTLPENGSMERFLRDEVRNKRSQDLEKYYRINGAVYVCKTAPLLEQKSFFLNANIYAYPMDRESSVDIDEEIDFKIAGLYL